MNSNVRRICRELDRELAHLGPEQLGSKTKKQRNKEIRQQGKRVRGLGSMVGVLTTIHKVMIPTKHLRLWFVSLAVLVLFFLAISEDVRAEDLSAEDEDTYTQKEDSYKLPSSAPLYEEQTPRGTMLQSPSYVSVDLKTGVGQVGSSKRKDEGGMGSVFSLAGAYNLGVNVDTSVNMGVEVSSSRLNFAKNRGFSPGALVLGMPLLAFGVRVGVARDVFKRSSVGGGVSFSVIPEETLEERIGGVKYYAATQGFVTKLEFLFSMEVFDNLDIQLGGGYSLYKIYIEDFVHEDGGGSSGINAESDVTLSMPHVIFALHVKVW